MSQFKNVNVAYYHVTNWEAAKKFYGEVLGWPIAYASDEVGWYEYGRDGEAHIAINRRGEGDPLPGPNGGATITLTVADVYQTQAELQAKGIKCDEILNIPGVVTIGTFYDPDGNRLQFVPEAPPPA